VRTYTIDRCLTDPRLLGAALGDAVTWQAWRIVLKAAFGIELNREEARTFAAVAGGRAPPAKRVRELWAIIGRRGGKSRMAAAIACFIACFTHHKLSPGERGMVLVLASSVEQAKIVFGYCLAFLRESPVLRREVVETTRGEIRLRNGIVIAVHSNSFRTVRGRTLCAVIFDETAFWRDDTSAAPDVEIYTAVLPSLATTNGMLVGISSPYRKTGMPSTERASALTAMTFWWCRAPAAPSIRR
jgi:phage terminase large subunit-like protein